MSGASYLHRTRHRTRFPGIYFRLVDESNPDGLRRWIIWYSDSESKGHTETLPLGATLEDAKNRRNTLQARKAQGETLLRTRKTVSELLDEWLESRKDSLAPHTVTVYTWGIETHLKKHLGRYKLQDLSASHIARMRSDLVKAGLKKNSIKKLETPLKNALNVAVRDGYINVNPFSKLLPHERVKADQKEMRCLSTEDLSSLLLSTSKEPWRTLFSALTFTGMRISEALSLTWDDVDLMNNLIHVRKSKTDAGVRSVILIDALKRRLTALQLQQAPGVQFVFSNGRGAPVQYRQARYALGIALKKAGLPAYTLHELRHTFASILIAQGRSLPFIAEQMGHADAGITLKTYAHLYDAEEEFKEAQERLQATFGGMV